MNIDNMTDEQKSVMLAKLVGWKIIEKWDGETLWDETGKESLWYSMGGKINIYDPAKMALAWRVLNRAVRCEGEIDDKKSRVNFYGFVNFGHLCREKIAKDLYLFMPPEQAQRLWLDKILSLAIEAGMVGETS